MPYCVNKSPTNQLHLRTTIDKQALAHVIQALVQSQLQKHTSLSNPNQISKYILDSRVFLAQP